MTTFHYSSTFRFLTGAITFLLVLGLAAAVVWTLNTQPTTIILPTPIPSRTATATPVPTVALGSELLVSAGGFSLRPPSGYRAAVQNNTVSLTNGAGDTLFVLRGEWLADGESLTESLQAAVAGLTPTMVIDAAGIQPVSIDGGEAVGAELTGGEDGPERAGRAELWSAAGGQTVLLLGSARRADWEAKVGREFAALLASVAFAPLPTPTRVPTTGKVTATAAAATPTVRATSARTQLPAPEPTAPLAAATPVAAPVTVLLIPTPTPGASTLTPGASTLTSDAQAPRLAGRWRTLSDANAMVDLAVISDTLWIATEGGALAWKKSAALPVKFTAVEGLRGNRLTAVANCPLPGLGVLFGSDQGLQIFAADTGSWSFLDPANSPMDASDVTALYCDPRNEFLVIGYAAHGLDIFDVAADTWRHLDRSSGLAANDVRELSVVGDRAQIWVVANDGVTVAAGPDSTFLTVDNSPLVSDTIGALATGPGGAVWLGGEGVLYRVQGEDWTVYDADRVQGTPFPTSLITGLAVASDGALWIGDRTGAVCRFDPATSRCTDFFRDAPGMAAGPLTSLQIDEAGRAYYTTAGNGYSVYDGAAWRTFTKADDFLRGNAVTALAQDPDAPLWIATERGVQGFDATGRQTAWFDAADIGMPLDSVSALLPDAAGGLWVAGQGASYFDGRNWEQYTVDDGLAGETVRAAAVDDQDRTWFGTDEGLSIWNGEQFFNITGDRGLPSSDIRALAGEGPVMWIGSRGGGLYRFEENELQILNRRNTGLPSDNITALAVAADGLWIGSDQGIARLEEGVLTVSRELTAPVTALAVQDDLLWAGTADQGVYAFDGSTWTQITTADALPADAITALSAQADRAWIGGRTGGAVEFRRP